MTQLTARHTPYTAQASQKLAMNDVSRHVADGVLKDCVDEIIAEVCLVDNYLHVCWLALLSTRARSSWINTHIDI